MVVRLSDQNMRRGGNLIIETYSMAEGRLVSFQKLIVPISLVRLVRLALVSGSVLSLPLLSAADRLPLHNIVVRAEL